MTTTDGLPHDLVTTDDVTRTLRDLGIAGRVVMVHTSMRRVGNVVGGEDALLRGILAAAGPTGVQPRATPASARNSSTAALNAAGASSGVMWPAPGTITSRARGITSSARSRTPTS